ncbi:uncharacterized protein LOC125662250 [Ostrea edulis]|uniref:uncharacterized protein LOC125662250 n=1 Tax=Ostrea edulis TaxID=37623 RepID=UPI0024AFD8A5|nr:uncharacterized protein LOC125662250 [Ostrea edulis]
MHKFAIPACLVSVCLFLQTADAQDCANPKLQTCVTNFTTAATSAGQDKTNICSAANSYLKCVNRIIADCNLDTNSGSVIIQAIVAAKSQLTQAGCSNGVGGNTQDCATPKIQACVTNFTMAATSAGQDKTNICSAANYYLNCVNKVVSDCNMDPRSSSVISQTITSAKTQLAQGGCDQMKSSPLPDVIG